MRDYRPRQLPKQRSGPTRNRLKKPPRERKPVDLRPYLKMGARWAGFTSLVATAACALYFGYRLIGSTLFFPLKRIDVTGIRRLDRNEILAYAGVREGAPMLRLDVAHMGEHLEKNPWIESVAVRRCFPGTLNIRIVERDPVAIVSMGYLYYADRKGEVFKPLNDGDRLDYPVVTGITEDDLQRDPEGTRAALQGAGELIDRLRGSAREFRLEDVSEIHYDKGFGFTLFTMQGGVPVRLGTDGFPDKLDRLARIYRDLRAQMPGLEYIDANYSDKIVVKRS